VVVLNIIFSGILLLLIVGTIVIIYRKSKYESPIERCARELESVKSKLEKLTNDVQAQRKDLISLGEELLTSLNAEKELSVALHNLAGFVGSLCQELDVDVDDLVDKSNIKIEDLN
jgi:hypothetical protein